MQQNLSDFFRDLLDWEEQQYSELIHPWDCDLRDSIVLAFEDSVSESSVKGSICPIPRGTSNQSIGNKVEKYIVPILDKGLSGFSISKCRGPGYPDQTLIQQSTNLHIPLEMKATANWNEKDTIRRVLTGSSQKLRAQFSAPIYHLILTVSYANRQTESVTIDRIRLDFLEPTTTVNAKYEASVNHKILTSGNHYSKTI